MGHASTCNSVGQTAGFFLGYVVFVILVSPEFCNKWIRTIPQDTGLVTFSGNYYFVYLKKKKKFTKVRYGENRLYSA